MTARRHWTFFLFAMLETSSAYRTIIVGAGTLLRHDILPSMIYCPVGIHGASLAYYLTKMGEKPLVIERSGVAAAASGKSGGFLAREWGSGPTVALHQKSFDLHKQLGFNRSLLPSTHIL